MPVNDVQAYRVTMGPQKVMVIEEGRSYVTGTMTPKKLSQ